MGDCESHLCWPMTHRFTSERNHKWGCALMTCFIIKIHYVWEDRDKTSPKLHRQGRIRLFHITFNILTDIFFKKGNVTARQQTEQHAIPSIEPQKTNQQGADIPPNHHAPSYHQSKNKKEETNNMAAQLVGNTRLTSSKRGTTQCKK